MYTKFVNNIAFVKLLFCRLFLGLSLMMMFTLNAGYKGAMISALSVPARPKAFGEFSSQHR